jgi:hypothetical protein
MRRQGATKRQMLAVFKRVATPQPHESGPHGDAETLTTAARPCWIPLETPSRASNRLTRAFRECHRLFEWMSNEEIGALYEAPPTPPQTHAWSDTL